MGVLTDKTCSWFQKSVQLQIITATRTKNAREIREIARFFPHCTLDVFPIALAHRARATTTYLNANNENFFDFPPKSPDLNTIESIWDELNRCVRRTGAIPATLNQLRAI